MTTSFYNPVIKKSRDKIIDKSIMDGNKTFYNRIYLRTYQPDSVRQMNTMNQSSFAQNHLQQQPYKNASSILKRLLRPRDMTTERTRNLNFTKSNFSNEADRKIFDYSEKNNTMIYFPDFRANNQKHSEVKLNNYKAKEKGFRLRLTTTYRGKYDHQVWNENKGSLNKLDPYIDGSKEVGKLERIGDKKVDNSSPRDFLLTTSQFSKQFDNGECNSMRSIERTLMKTSTLSVRDTSKMAVTVVSSKGNKQSQQTFACSSSSQMGSPRGSKIYFKSLEQGKQYHQNKKAVLNSIKKELQQVQGNPLRDLSTTNATQYGTFMNTGRSSTWKQYDANQSENDIMIMDQQKFKRYATPMRDGNNKRIQEKQALLTGHVNFRIKNSFLQDEGQQDSITKTLLVNRL